MNIFMALHTVFESERFATSFANEWQDIGVSFQMTNNFASIRKVTITNIAFVSYIFMHFEVVFQSVHILEYFITNWALLGVGLVQFSMAFHSPVREEQLSTYVTGKVFSPVCM